MSAIYIGPQCPLCTATLDVGSIRAGTTECPACSRAFEATPFAAVDRRHEAVQAVTDTPEGVAAACANHARNAAVTSCHRCGLFVCSLCEMRVEGGSYCPSCFDRARQQGTLQSRYRDYASMAVSAVVFGFLCYLVPGVFAIYWAAKGIGQRRAEGRSIAGMVVTMLFGILQTLALLGLVVAMIIGFASAGEGS